MNNRKFQKIYHSLSLIMQAMKIDDTLEFYDDGHHYQVYDTAPAHYIPVTDKIGYCMYGGTYGECVRYMKGLKNDSGQYKIVKSY